MKQSMQLVLCVAILMTYSACSGSRIKMDAGENVVKAKTIEVSANWIKDKGKKFDVDLNIKNNTDHGIIIMLAEISCAKGKLSGGLKHTFFNTGEKTIDFTAHERKTFRLVCNLGSETEGNYKITIGEVYNNKSGDGKSKDKVIEKNIVWTAPGQREE